MNKRDFEDHLREQHYPDTKYYIIPKSRDDIPEKNINIDGNVPPGLIKIDEEDDFDTRRIKHIRNLNSGRY